VELPRHAMKKSCKKPAARFNLPHDRASTITLGLLVLFKGGLINSQRPGWEDKRNRGFMRILGMRIHGVTLTMLAVMVAALRVASADPVPQDRRISWTYTGVPGGIPNRTNICATFSPGATAASINSAIQSWSSSGGGVVKLNAGTYNITGINVTSNNVTLRGAGADPETPCMEPTVRIK